MAIVPKRELALMLLQTIKNQPHGEVFVSHDEASGGYGWVTIDGHVDLLDVAEKVLRYLFPGQEVR